jgi:hypothetical protein
MKKLTFFRRVSDERVIDSGRVGCPLRRRDVDIEICTSCGWASAIDLAAKPAVVRCQPSQLPDWLVRPWV